MTNISFAIKYHYGDAEDGRLDMYDAAVSLQGFSKALSITTHALLNEGEVRRKGNRIEGAQLFLLPSKRGSFEQLVTLAINNQEAIGASIAAAAFYDMIKWTWAKTLDLADYEPQTPHVKKIADRVDPTFGEIEEALEIPLEQAHRPIKKDSDVIVTLTRPRVGEIIRLDTDTLSSVSVSLNPDVIEGIVCNITRYNILSGYGRLYDDELGRTVSFVIGDEVTSNQKQLLTWSLHYAQEEEGEGKIEIDARKVESAKGTLKRYVISRISQKEN